MPERSRYHLDTANLTSYEDRFRQLYWRIIWTHKIHEKQADIYSAERKWVDYSAMALTAISGCGILAANQFASPPYNVIPFAINCSGNLPRPEIARNRLRFDGN